MCCVFRVVPDGVRAAGNKTFSKGDNAVLSLICMQAVLVLTVSDFSLRPFTRLSLDLLFGVPFQTLVIWFEACFYSARERTRKLPILCTDLF